MGKVTGFLEHDRKDRSYFPVKNRIKDFKEFLVPLNDKELKNQASRCMDCGIPTVTLVVLSIILYLTGMIWFIMEK